MRGFEGNYHGLAAVDGLEEGWKDPVFRESVSTHPEQLLQLMQMQATMALAHEQRTANMIALIPFLPRDQGEQLSGIVEDRMGI